MRRARFAVERFDVGRWTRQPGRDGETYLVNVSVSGVEESFTIAQPVSGSAFATESPRLGRRPTKKDWEALARVKIMEAVGQGFLNGWPASETLGLSAIVSQQVDDLFAEAIREGLI